MPDGWGWSKINTIAFVTKLAGFEYTKNIAPNLCENGIPLFKGKNVQNSTIIYEFESYIPESVSDELQRSQITRKCILTPYVGTIGNIGIHNRSGKYHLGSNVGKIELYNSNATIIEEYVVAYLQSKYGYQQLTKHMKATAQASISIEAIRDVYLPIPPASEQHKICDMLFHTLELIKYIETSKNDINEQIASTKSKILDLAIRGKLVPQDPNDEPASVLLERIRTEKEELIKQGKIKRDKRESVIFKGDDNSYYEKIGNDVTCIDDEIPFYIPDTWSWTRISTITDITMGSSPKSQDICNDNQYIEFHQGKIYFSKKKLMKSNQYTRKTTKLASKQSVLLCVRAPVGELNITDRDICIGRGLASIKSLGNINEEFIFYWLHPYKTYLVNQSTGSTFSAITSDAVRKILIPLPPLMEQKKILDKIQKVFALLENLETVN